MVGGLERTVTTSTQPASLPPRREIWEWREGSPAWIKSEVLTIPLGWNFNY